MKQIINIFILFIIIMDYNGLIKKKRKYNKNTKRLNYFVEDDKNVKKYFLFPMQIFYIKNFNINLVLSILSIIFSLFFMSFTKDKKWSKIIILFFGNLFASYIISNLILSIFYNVENLNELAYFRAFLFFLGTFFILFLLNVFIEITSIISSIVIDFVFLSNFLVKDLRIFNNFIILLIFVCLEIIYFLLIYKKIIKKEIIKFSILSFYFITGTFFLINVFFKNNTFIFTTIYINYNLSMLALYILLILFQLYINKKQNK